jgi:enamine deaminase RidA (YjgF/YER057c/UK114 family)
MTGVAIAAEGFLRHPSFSPAVAVGPGTTIHVAGQLPLDPDLGVVGTGIEEQVERVWTQIEAILSAGGASLADVVSVRAYTIDRIHIDAIVAARQRRFTGLVPPASALVVVAGLAAEGALVEIEAVAVMTERAT